MRRKGTPCACECNPCKGKNYVRAVNNVSPDPNGDLELKAGNGIAISQSGDNEITITNDAIASSFVAGDNIEINPVGNNLEIRVTDDVSINNLNVAGDIIQQGAAYETHAEKVYTTNDYIYMRDGAVGGLAAGDFSGFQVIKYDGTNDGRLVIDNSGVARVGDVGDEQPLLTRSESGQLNNGDLLQWNGTSQKAVSSGVNTSQIVRGSGNIGSDTKPVKVVNGVATPVSNNLQTELSVNVQELTPRNDITGVTIAKADSSPSACRFITYGKMAILNIAITITGTRSGQSGWYSLFPDLDLGNYYIPYIVKTSSASNLLQGTSYYFNNGQTYNETVDLQIVLIHA